MPSASLSYQISEHFHAVLFDIAYSATSCSYRSSYRNITLPSPKSSWIQVRNSPYMRPPERVEVSLNLYCIICCTDVFFLDQVVESLLNVSYAPPEYIGCPANQPCFLFILDMLSIQRSANISNRSAQNLRSLKMTTSVFRSIGLQPTIGSQWWNC